ncbi:unnamed protein product [Bursaphelenchus okinawaensis]|uniref:Anion exchange protein n=1 Tax=Bursaphelenchus okinawaensis TaxID=465554 RepID=A0A811L8L9_9BILA|nr:unnamed protein product [Bursaphelenchus okinawaensis]CAG9119886.1 unnamed protein product [Bursaphelenchus okinawaensis]
MDVESLALTKNQVRLLQFETKNVGLKHFKYEYRARRDVHKLTKSASIYLDLEENGLKGILSHMLDGVTLKNCDKDTVLRQLISVDVQTEVNFTKNRLQSLRVAESDAYIDQNWVLLHANVDEVTDRSVTIARLKHPVNLGPYLEDVTFVIIVLCPSDVIYSKQSFETAQSFATLFSSPEHRVRLKHLDTEGDFKEALIEMSNELEERHGNVEMNGIGKVTEQWWPGKGICDDFKRRWGHYRSDYMDGLKTGRDVQKTISAAVFLYFSVLPTAIALGMLNDLNTNGKINVKKEILSQVIGGLWFGLFGGQLFLVMLSTAPISIYIEVIQQLSNQYHLDFFKVYTMTGIWCSIFLIIAATFEFSKVMKYARRSLEELFGLFISLALIIRSLKAMVSAIGHHFPYCIEDYGLGDSAVVPCSRSSGLMFIVLALGTFIISYFLYRFRVSCYLGKLKRELLADYSLPIGVMTMSAIYLIVFNDVTMQSFSYDDTHSPFTVTAFSDQSIQAHVISLLLGIPLAILFFMDQLIVTNTVDNNQNNLQKGSASNWDLVIVAIMNVVLSVLGLPWMHGALPQAFMHLKALADVEDKRANGVVESSIVKNRETRCATLLAHLLMIPTYLFLLPYLKMIPTAIFHGLFLYLAITSMDGNELVQRISLIFTEQRLYPPFHYLRRVPQKIVHLFTVIESLQLVILVSVGHVPWPIVELAFPVITFLFIPFNYLVVPKVIKPHYLSVLDGAH